MVDVQCILSSFWPVNLSKCFPYHCFLFAQDINSYTLLLPYDTGIRVYKHSSLWLFFFMSNWPGTIATRSGTLVTRSQYDNVNVLTDVPLILFVFLFGYRANNYAGGPDLLRCYAISPSVLVSLPV